MPTNPRNYYPSLAIGFAPEGTPLNVSGYRAAKGVQSYSVTTNFNLEAISQLGQLEIYENVEGIPSVEMTIEKVIDGRPLIQHLATPTATNSSLGGRYNNTKCMVVAPRYNVTQEFASGIPLSVDLFSGMYVNSINFNIPVEGNMTESVTLVGNDKTLSSGTSYGNVFTTGTLFNGNESPILSSGGVQRRENISMARSRWPLSVPGISGLALSGVNPTLAGGELGAHIQNVSIAMNLGRTELFELGRRGPYFRFANFPVEVTCTIEVTANEFGDSVNAAQEGANLIDERIFIALDQGVTIDLGTKNKLRSINVNGGDTGGGNQTVSYEYFNLNSMRVVASGDPAGLTS
jgi:hypothetical protein